MIPWRLLPLVVTGGVVGVALRQAMLLPFGGEASLDALVATVAINALGSGGLGVVVGRIGDRSPARRAFLGTGVLGGFTTYSGFAVLLTDVGPAEPPVTAVLVAGVALLVAGGAALAGLWAGEALSRRAGREGAP